MVTEVVHRVMRMGMGAVLGKVRITIVLERKLMLVLTTICVGFVRVLILPIVTPVADPLITSRFTPVAAASVVASVPVIIILVSVLLARVLVMITLSVRSTLSFGQLLHGVLLCLLVGHAAGDGAGLKDKRHRLARVADFGTRVEFGRRGCGSLGARFVITSSPPVSACICLRVVLPCVGPSRCPCLLLLQEIMHLRSQPLSGDRKLVLHACMREVCVHTCTYIYRYVCV